MNYDDMQKGRFFTTDGFDIWEMNGYFSMPSCTLKNLKTGDLETFGVGGLMAERFKRLATKEPIAGAEDNRNIQTGPYDITVETR